MSNLNDDAPITQSKERDAPDGSLVGRSVTINRPKEELYAFWRDLSRLPEFMENIISVTPLDGQRSHWVVKAPGGSTVEWDAVITETQEGEMIAWKSEDGANVPNSGRIDFRDAGARGTVVTATIAYDPPAGVIGKVVAKLFQREPAIQARRELRRFKQLMEAGEIATASRTRKQLEEEDA